MFNGAAEGAHGALDSHFRYLSGLLLAIGLAFGASIPKIERRSERFVLLSATVVVGGLARLGAWIASSGPGNPPIFALGMELVIVPLLFLWHRRVAKRFQD